MPSPSRGGGPAAMPKYQRIAAALRRDLDRAAHAPGGRLPSERSLAARYQVNRQTIRAALQHLREDGLVVTGRRGSRPVGIAAGARPAAHPAPPVSAPGESRLTLVTVPPSLAALLGMGGGDRTLVHHRRERGPAGEVVRHAVTYLSPGVVARIPELARYGDRAAAVRDEDLGPLHRWLERAAADGRLAETITMTRTTHPQGPSPACGLTVRRTLHDSSGRLLAVTDLAFPSWDRLTFHRDPAESGFCVI
ncbi:GntR family transcriptional regulator [Streptomyces sp. NBC_01408]|uniref:GntR family transcriptional regulator n=1 Tax=Streptomyces sp. NBC_01408 TaxID=2903855 RepID=UPI00224EA312|nr:GntR family transcriptional regulator [Streptomyces sp. NBC_01408]MCX4695169.1 GntR family transcriptional regulator [Streptomyces sp. NBC_01408]MCX4695185.1 GntR family transcriptional regulator [Streptomyces sp. NBC_01408]